jgi:hypothetical protein
MSRNLSASGTVAPGAAGAPWSAFLDGETLFAVSGPSTLWSYTDFMFMMAATTWLDSADQLEKLIPPSGERSSKLGRAARI